MQYDDLKICSLEAIGRYLGIEHRELWHGRSETCHCPTCGTAHPRWLGGDFRDKFVGPDGTIRRFLSIPDFAERMGISPSTVRRWIRVGKLSKKTGLIVSEVQSLVDEERCSLLVERKPARVAA
jgi:hypothetical protein